MLKLPMCFFAFSSVGALSSRDIVGVEGEVKKILTDTDVPTAVRHGELAL